MCSMKVKQLESKLQSVSPFTTPQLQYEQYCTPPYLAACMISTAATTYDDIEDCAILDLGCGTGMLGIGSGLMGGGVVVGVEVDVRAIHAAQQNAAAMNVSMEFVNHDILQSDMGSMKNRFDTVIMNPPYGTKSNAGIDCVFIQKALSMVHEEGTALS